MGKGKQWLVKKIKSRPFKVEQEHFSEYNLGFDFLNSSLQSAKESLHILRAPWMLCNWSNLLWIESVILASWCVMGICMENRSLCKAFEQCGLFQSHSVRVLKVMLKFEGFAMLVIQAEKII
ncbi:unnamed protein product [Orchesella dallaii]|uniref:Uncharacterized protein n=1 Tax=Orchesella dallaii TaxID=48710 RepID=A0ABP1PXT9_9HEXA